MLTQSILKRKRIEILVLYLLASSLLWLGYAKFIVPIFGYSGFKWSPNTIKVCESLLLTMFFASVLPSSVKRPSDFFIHVHFLLPVLPMLILYAAADLSRVYIYFVMLAFMVVFAIRKFHVPTIVGNIIPLSIIIWGIVLFVTGYITYIIQKGGLAYFNLDLVRVYEFRSEAAQNLPGFAVSNKKWHFCLLAITGSIMMFALTNHKGPLFYPFFVMIVYYIMKSKTRIIPLFIASHVVTMILSLSAFFIWYFQVHGEPWLGILIGSIGFRRGYFVPPQLNFAYYDYFSTREYTMWAQSKLSFGLLEYPYDIDVPHLIGYNFFDNINVGANTGWLGSGYMQLGIVGMLIYAFIIGLLLSIGDMIARRKPIDISVAALFTPFLYLFLSSDLPTVMLTHGLLFALFLLWICQLEMKVLKPSNHLV